MPLRVIAGSAKGRKLKLVPGEGTRPIMDRVKEALFSILGREIFDAVMLDLFAGTGSVGIEALSRGASHVTFVDSDRAAIQTIHENLKIANVADRAQVRRGDALELLKQPPPRPFDLIFIAPPQYKDLWIQTLQALEKNHTWIPAGTNVIVQIDPKEKQDLALKYLETTDQRQYGKTLLLFFEAKNAEES
ncbi:MAG: 16S rRNA (guanine(966)-N(2))-methyltransferase RsmD [Anaerolineae bacterium]|jgi:16S rRNA (guanine(966)-N(2))-methyltransferase RsmD|nr:16S rRNA (guanine(966)-N(2))-methyltransferase RsmD [Anaerolineae bacterium]